MRPERSIHATSRQACGYGTAPRPATARLGAFGTRLGRSTRSPRVPVSVALASRLRSRPVAVPVSSLPPPFTPTRRDRRPKPLRRRTSVLPHSPVTSRSVAGVAQDRCDLRLRSSETFDSAIPSMRPSSRSSSCSTAAHNSSSSGVDSTRGRGQPSASLICGIAADWIDVGLSASDNDDLAILAFFANVASESTSSSLPPAIRSLMAFLTWRRHSVVIGYAGPGLGTSASLGPRAFGKAKRSLDVSFGICERLAGDDRGTHQGGIGAEEDVRRGTRPRVGDLEVDRQ